MEFLEDFELFGHHPESFQNAYVRFILCYEFINLIVIHYFNHMRIVTSIYEHLTDVGGRVKQTRCQSNGIIAVGVGMPVLQNEKNARKNFHDILSKG